MYDSSNYSKWTYNPVTLNELSPVFNNSVEKIERARSSVNFNNQLVSNEKRHDILAFQVDRLRGFNYSNLSKKYRPYEIPKDAYDLNFYNPGFKEL